MRLLALTNLFPNPYHPTRAPFNRRQLRGLSERHDVRVIAPIGWVEELKAQRAGKPSLPADRRLIQDGLIVDHPRYYYPPKFGRRWYGEFFRKSVAQTFDRVVKEFSPDIVLAPWAYPDGWAGVRLGKRYGLPVVVKCHGSDVLLLDENPSRRRPTQEAVRSADGVIAVSRHLAAHLQKLGVAPQRIRVVVDGVDRQLFRPGPKADARRRLGLSDGPPVALFVGNLVPVKGLDIFFTACARLAAMGVAHRVVVIGGGALRTTLERQVENLGLGKGVQFKGVLRHEELPDWYQAADLFVLPSRSEGIPNVLLEASACDTPWVASKVGGIPEIADLGRSRLVPPNSPDALADAIREMLASPPGPPARTPTGWEQCVDELEEFLVSVRDSTRVSTTVGTS